MAARDLVTMLATSPTRLAVTIFKTQAHLALSERWGGGRREYFELHFGRRKSIIERISSIFLRYLEGIPAKFRDDIWVAPKRISDLGQAAGAETSPLCPFSRSTLL